MKKIFTAVFVVMIEFILILSLYSCASILHGTDQEISISSTPDSAKVVIKTFGGVKVKEGVTPLKTELRRKDEYRVTVSKEGYEDNEVVILNSTSAAVWANVLCGGIIGLIIDFSNGAAYELKPETIHVDLVEVVGANKLKEYYLVVKISDEKGEVKTIVQPFKKKVVI